MIYLIERTDNIGWDEYIAIVVRATTPKEAKEMAKKFSSDFAHSIKCKRVNDLATKNRIILASYNAG